MGEIPEKLYYKASEVCRYTDTQPYVLRFWESEFPQLAPEKSRSGQRVYRPRDLQMILRIKKLLYDEEFTIADARRRLENEFPGVGSGEGEEDGDGPPAVRPVAARGEGKGRESGEDEAEGVLERARAEIESLRRRLAETDAARLHAEAALEENERQARARRERFHRMADRLEQIVRTIESRGARGTKGPRRGK